MDLNSPSLIHNNTSWAFAFFFVEVERFVGRKIFHTVFLRKAQQRLIHVIFFGYSVTVQLDIEVVTKQAMPPFESFLRLFFADVQNQVGHFTGNEPVVAMRSCL